MSGLPPYWGAYVPAGAERDQAMAQMHKEGWSVAKIAAAYGLTEGSVRAPLTRMGLLASKQYLAETARKERLRAQLAAIARARPRRRAAAISVALANFAGLDVWTPERVWRETHGLPLDAGTETG